MKIDVTRDELSWIIETLTVDLETNDYNEKYILTTEGVKQLIKKLEQQQKPPQEG